ncbi:MULTISPECIES: Dps family protein [Thalassobaculum]|uniref:Starvation-inducible DNA-binding protein n=1 Tax=Thalassobaculum litoreum DSM 18839 TaxID=1123362 RepID=A0A8G2F0K2_9PROT|nr:MULTISPECIES: DNA starvation/stationary phase protection protein [Thalassobaculum]SDG50229.1 starvation-inducible DNA-binding protein [Thalassobaculum litoreum DSM 18839]
MSANSKPVIAALEQALADTYALALKTQNYHWNVEGPTFYGLHNLFEEQYNDAHGAVDELAERIRALGAPAPGSFQVFMDATKIADAKQNADAKAMVSDLAASHETMGATLRDGISVAEDAGDPATADMLTARLTTHDKHAWMLRSLKA